MLFCERCAMTLITPHTEDGWQLFCRSLLLPVDLKPPLGPLVFIWGEPVLRRYYTVYARSPGECCLGAVGFLQCP